MSRLPKSKKEVFAIRMDEDTKTKLEKLAKSSQFKNNNSAVVRYLIHKAFLKGY